MAIRYKKLERSVPSGKELNGILKCEDGESEFRACIPLDPANTDYQEYLEWVAEGKTAEAAD